MSDVYAFENCRVIIDDERRRVETVFSDGTGVEAAPMLDRESIERARELGYAGADADAVWEMTRWHDLLHTLAAEACGEPFSATLHAVAHEYRLAPGVVVREESLVLFVARLLERGIADLLEARRWLT